MIPRQRQRIILEIYKCGNCGRIVMVTHEGAGQLACCGLPMEQQNENVVDASNDKHVPVVETGKDGVVVKVGSVPHPMEPEHYTEWVEMISGSTLHVVGLKPGDATEVTIPVSSTDVKVRAYCNQHGLWSNKPHRA